MRRDFIDPLSRSTFLALALVGCGDTPQEASGTDNDEDVSGDGEGGPDGGPEAGGNDGEGDSGAGSANDSTTAGGTDGGGDPSDTTDPTANPTTAGEPCEGDEECPSQSAAFCVEGECAGCLDAPADACETADPATPVCSDGGSCVECVEDSQCSSGACDVGAGQCFEASPIVVAVGYGMRRVRSVDAVNWDNYAVFDVDGGDDRNQFRGVGYGDGVFVAVGGGAASGEMPGGSLSMTTRDGVTWENEYRDARSWMGGVAWLESAEVFVAGGANGFLTRSTDHGASWDEGTPFAGGHYRAVAAGDGVAVAVGATNGSHPECGGCGRTRTTTDGVTWTEEEVGGETLWAIAFGNGVFVAAGNNGRVSSSDDGQGWTTTTLALGNLRDVAFVQGEFYVVGGGEVWVSSDGVDWSLEPGQGRAIDAYAYGNFITMAAPGGGVGVSESLASWDTVFQPDDGALGLVEAVVGVPSSSK